MYRLANISFCHSSKKHTLRGMHYERPDYAQAKLILAACVARHNTSLLICALTRFFLL